MITNRTLLLPVALVAFASVPATAQVMSANRAHGGFNYEQSWTSLIRRPQIQAEIELVPKQLEQINQLYKKYLDDYRDVYRKVQPPGKRMDALAREELAERHKELREKLTEQIMEALLPHQVERIKEVAFQYRIKQGGSAFGDPGILKLLEIDEEQAKRLRERGAELRKEAIAAYRNALKEANEKLLEELTPEQRAKLKKLQGEPYNPPPFE